MNFNWYCIQSQAVYQEDIIKFSFMKNNKFFIKKKKMLVEFNKYLIFFKLINIFKCRNPNINLKTILIIIFRKC